MNFNIFPLFAIFWLCFSAFGYETVEDAARIARRLVDLSEDAVSTMATVYNSGHPTLAGDPFAIMEYYASCHRNGSLTLLFLPISRHSQNILHSNGHRASITVASPGPAARKPRVSLMGSVTVFDHGDVPNKEEIKACYLAKHPDARWWLPDDEEAAHLAYWARFDPQSVYFVGGFGDRHYIGYVPLDMYQKSAPAANRFIVQQDYL